MFRQSTARKSGQTTVKGSDTYVNVSGNFNQRSISGMSLLPSQFGDVSEKYWWGEVSLNVCLLEWLNLAGEDMFERKRHVVLRFDSFGDHVQGEQGGLGTTTCQLDPALG
jgi:hypothetical protein